MGPAAARRPGGIPGRLQAVLIPACLRAAARPGLRFGVEVFNLTDERVSDIDYYYESRLPGEPEEGVADLHFHSAEPRTARVVVEWRF